MTGSQRENRYTWLLPLSEFSSLVHTAPSRSRGESPLLRAWEPSPRYGLRNRSQLPFPRSSRRIGGRSSGSRHNVHVAIGSAQNIALPGRFDALLLFAAHEVLTSPEALDHVLPHLKEGARIAAFGARLSYSRRGRLLNPLVGLLTQTLLPASSAAVDARPWRLLEDRAGKLHIEEPMAGLLYLVSGSLLNEQALGAGDGLAARSRGFDRQLEIVPVDIDLT
jgi:hypothetical protein